MTFKEYRNLVEETERARYVANNNVVRICNRIVAIMPHEGDFDMETMARVKALYAMLGEAIETARTTSDIVDYYKNDEDACTDVVLDRITPTWFNPGDEENYYQKDEES